MSGVVLFHGARPDDLADTLDVWAAQRETHDVCAAALARRLSRTCRVLAAAQEAELIDCDWRDGWERVRNEATALLRRGDDGSQSEGDLRVPERITRPEADIIAEDDRLTPILPPAPQFRVA